MSRFRSLLFLSMADRRPLSIQESTYFVGSNSFRGGSTSLTKSSEEIVFVSNDTRDGVAIRFICENRRSHSLEDIGMVDRACCSGINLSEHFFSTRYSRNNNDIKDYSEQLEFLNSEPYYVIKKLQASLQIFRYAVPARTVTKKHCLCIVWWS